MYVLYCTVPGIFTAEGLFRHDVCTWFVICMYGHTYSKKSMYRPGKVANPARLLRGQLNRENEYFPVHVRSRLRVWPRETGSAVQSRVSLIISILRRLNHLLLTYEIPPEFLPRSASIYYVIKTPIRHRVSPEFIGSHAFAYRWRSLPRVRRHRASKPQGSSE